MNRQPRSVLFVPGHKLDWVAKAVASGADAIVLDLEDSVPRLLKGEARMRVAESIVRARGSRGELGIYVRPNALDTGLAEDDLEATAQCGLDGFFVPKVREPGDVLRYEALIDGFGSAESHLIVPIETAAAIVACEEIAQSSPRVRAMVGATARYADISRAVGYRWTPEGLETLYLRSRILVACRAASVHPLTGLWEDVHDLDGLRDFARAGRTLGYRGQIVIHPSHVAIVNEEYGVDSDELAFYRGLVAAFEEAERRGDAAVIYEGQHIDQAHVDTARERLQQVETQS